MQVLLMAGGGGTRLWPLSTEEKPKQFLALFDDRSLLRTTFERVLPLVSPDQVWLSGNAKHADLLKKDLPELNTEQIILETAKRDNAAAICLSQLLMNKAGIDANEVIVMLPCDHRISNEEEFRTLIQNGEAFLKANPEYLVTIGIVPTHPETGYGYIAHNQKALSQQNDVPVLAVEQFVEKPNIEKAKEYVASGKYLWNSGIYMWTLGTMLRLFADLLPNIYSLLSANLTDWEQIYHQVDATSLDYGISERIKTIATIPAHNLGWSDVGDFSALGEFHDEKIRTLDVSDSYLRNETSTQIRVIGMKNIIVVNTPDGLVICDRKRAQDIKKLA
ncbi:MAG: hypothetical protein HY817_00555 [Candidatus Abawacabacteria bacterium]|nr:hypothetical protein [Candidatus Abawacabacteria bacterium]